MASKRMFDRDLCDSDKFLEMPESSQNLYFHLGIRADDDGFVDGINRIMRTLQAKEDDYRILKAKGYVIEFQDPMNRVAVITHWHIHNYIRKDRYKPTKYHQYKQLLTEYNRTYYLIEDAKRLGIPVVDQRLTQISIDKTSIDKNRLDILRAIPLEGVEYSLTLYFCEKLIEASPHAVIPSTESGFIKWAGYNQELINLDHSEQTIKQVIDYSQKGWWSSRVMSTNKLKKNFNTMLTQVNQQNQPKKNDSKDINRDNTYTNDALEEKLGVIK